MSVLETNPLAISTIRRPEDCVEFLAAYIELGSLGFEYIAKYDEPLLPVYPAVQIMSGPMQKDLHGTHTWLLTIRAEIFVFHARMTQSRQTRSRDDLLLATKLVDYLERDISMGDKIIAGWVEAEIPGARPPSNNKGAAVISTRLTWSCTNEARF
jgi:hypothetical protein